MVGEVAIVASGPEAAVGSVLQSMTMAWINAKHSALNN